MFEPNFSVTENWNNTFTSGLYELYYFVEFNNIIVAILGAKSTNNI